MSILPILKWPDARLSQRCEPAGPGPDLEQLVTDMFETMYDAPGRGLAAPQVGFMLRLFVMDCGWKDGDMTPLVCINPQIVAQSDVMVTGEEGCLSIPGVLAPIERPEEITLLWQDMSGTVQTRLMTGFEARCAQHEYDHLEGLVTFDRLSAEARVALEAAYKGARA